MRATHRPLTTLALALCLFMAALEMTVVSTAMPTVVSDLGGIQSYAWVFTAYMLASTITVPIFGKLADLYGRKPILLFGTALFLVGSIASGLSTSMNMLIAFRTLQGLGAGAMQPVSLTIIGDIYTLEQRARVQGAFSAVWGISGLVGPLTGGLIVKHLTWHWVFFINVPVGVGVMALVVALFHEQMQRKAAEPIIPMSIFKIPAIAISSAAGALFSAAMFGATTYVPLYVQGVLGGSATLAGGMITPMIVGWPLASVVAGKLLLKMGFRPLIVGGLGLTVIGTTLMALLLRPDTSLLMPQVAMGLFGVGLGFSATALLIAVQTSVGWELRGVATASNMFFRTIGGALGVGLMGGVLVSHLLKDPSIPVAAANELLGPEHGKGLPTHVLQTLSGALGSGLTLNFWLICAASVAAFAVSLFFPRVHRAASVSASDVPASH